MFWDLCTCWMRNLRITSCTVLPAEDLLARALCFFLDCDRGTVWVSNRDELCCIENNKVCSMAPLSSHMTSCDDHVIGMEYLVDVECVCLALSNGNILLYNVVTSELECVGEIEVGVVCMGWSPEQDLVVMVTGEEKLVLMTKDFDPLAEKALHQKEFGEAELINVGWGKKSTQFHGSEGKPKTEQLKEKLPEPAVAWDDKKTRVSWRGDGDYFACSAIDPVSGSRVVRVWTRDCALHSTSETIVGLEQTLAWKPTGNLLASTQHKAHRSDVIFFELNGLQHGEFTFQQPPTDAHVKELLWNADSAVLCAWCTRRDSGEEWLQLWTVGNYHWYLKQEIKLAKSKEDGSPLPNSIIGLLWDPIVPLKLHLLMADGQYICYTWHWTISESKSHSLLNSSGVVVIDGSQLLYTPFRHAVIPPPVSASRLLLPAQVNEVAYSPLPNCNDFLAILSDFRVAVFSVLVEDTEPGGVAPLPVPQLVGTTSVGEASGGFHALRQFVWWRGDSLLAIGESGDVGGQHLVQFSLDVDRDNKLVKVTKCSSVLAPGPILCLHGNPDTGTAVMQLTSGEVMKISSVDSEGCVLSPWLLDSGSSLRYDGSVHCEKMELALFNGKERVIGLCEGRCLLYVDDLKVTSGCTSFGVHDEFLLLTMNTHICRFISLHSDPKVLEAVDAENLQYHDKSVRRTERGSRVVTAVPGDVRLILQMPRGNLETICPRALILSTVRKGLDKLEFGTVFKCMRKHRLNLNLIYDHNPKAFLDNISKFIEELGSASYINLFLTELLEEDTCKTMYPEFSGVSANDLKGKPAKSGGGKVDLVCTAVRDSLTKMGENFYLLSIITSYVKMRQPDLETVLTMIQKLKETQSKTPEAATSVTVANALKYTIYLVDVNELYNIALGMYNLPLAVMVAEKSQKDPKEYLPLLNRLRKLPLHYQRFKIDSQLKRFVKALHHISKCGADKFQECFSLIKAHSLYREALGIYTDRKSSEYKDIAAAYGHHLVETGKFKDGGIMFSQCGSYQEAFVAFEKANCWELVFVCSAQLQHSAAQRMEAARRIADSLKGSRRFSEAARVFLDYAEDVEEAVVALLDGSLWVESMRLLHLHRRCDLLETHLLPGLLEAHESRLALFEELHSNFTHHSSRLVVVRETKKQKQDAILEGTYAADEKDADLFSDTSSVTGQSTISSLNLSISSSQYSKSSGRSSKNRRKADRKKRRLREGGSHEEEALVEAMKEIVATVDGLQDDVAQLLPSLVQFGFTKEASAVQGSFARLSGGVRENMAAIWPSGGSSVAVGPADIQKSLGPDATVNSIIAAMTAAKQSPVINAGGPAPELRDSVNWKLELLTP